MEIICIFFKYSIDIAARLCHNIYCIENKHRETQNSFMVENNIRFSRADQLTQHLKERCRKLGIGEKFLSVRQIMDEFNVSQITVKQAMERLCESGVLEAQERHKRTNDK